MWLCYLIATVPLILGGSLWIFTRRITVFEWCAGTLIALGICAGFHWYTLKSQLTDMEIWSGPVIAVTHIPKWTCSSNEDEGPSQIERSASWVATVDYGRLKESYYIKQEAFQEIRKAFGVETLDIVPGHRPGYKSGDRNDYRATNKSGVLIPGHTTRTFQNRLKAGPNVFSFPEVPGDIHTFEHPAGSYEFNILRELVLPGEDEDQDDEKTKGILKHIKYAPTFRTSKRLLGQAGKHFSILEWDKLNARLGPDKRVNLIAVGFEGDASMGTWQEARWLGGKKNDLVICYGPPMESGKPSWTYCFGWTESDLVKRELASLFLNSRPNDLLLPHIEGCVRAHYRPHDWKQFDYLTIEPPPSAYPTLLLVMLIVQAGFWITAYSNANRRAPANAKEAEAAKLENEEARDALWHRTHLPNVKSIKDPNELLAVMRGGYEDSESGNLTPAMAAAHFIAKLNDRALIPALAELMLHPNSAGPNSAEKALNQMQISPDARELKASVPLFIKHLAVGPIKQFKQAVRMLNLIDPNWHQASEAKPYLSELKRQAMEGNEEALLRLGRLKAAGALLELYDSSALKQKGEILRHLGNAQAPKGMALCVEALPHPDLKIHALSALNAYGYKLRKSPEAQFAFEPTRQLVRDPDHWIVKEAAICLGWFGGDRAREALQQIETWTENLELTRAVKARAADLARKLIEAKDELECQLCLVRHLHAKEYSMRAQAMSAIERLADSRAAEPLIELYPSIVRMDHKAATLLVEFLEKHGGEIGRSFITHPGKMRWDLLTPIEEMREARKTGFIPVRWRG